MRLFLINFILLSSIGHLFTQQESSEKDNVFSIDSSRIGLVFLTEASYVGDFVHNFTGGFNRGSAYLGMANIQISFETGMIGLWEGGEFFISGTSTHGGTPSGELFGDFHIASNIEAGEHTFLQELWYAHSFESLEITIGLQDLNAKFVVNEMADSFLNSSFGIPSLISDNIPVPVFPLTAIGITAGYEINEHFTIQAALFDGLPDNFENNRYNINWRLDSRDGIQLFSELHYSTTINELPGIYKAGYYYHTHFFSGNLDGAESINKPKDNFGIYFLADQILYSKNEKNIGAFLQTAVSPQNKNSHNYYFGGGISFSGFISDAGEFGFAIAHAGFSGISKKEETTIELNYKIQLTDNFFIQPDAQYIINPAGADLDLDNALGAFIRFGIDF